MAYSEAVIGRARARLEQEKNEKERDNAARLARAYAEYPRLQEIDRLLKLTAAQAIAASFESGPHREEKIAGFRRRNLELQEERAQLLDEGEFENGSLDNQPICEHCGGRGYLGSRMCTCLKELCRQEQKRELTSLFITGRESFDHFRLDVYPDEYDSRMHSTARKVMTSVLADCRDYCTGFHEHADSLLFYGATGLGKTFLSACIARQIADQGFSVVYTTAIQMTEDYEKMKFGKRAEEEQDLTAKYQYTDLLIIDDLGMEMTTQFTVSALYSVINSRLVERKPTIISTNIGPAQLAGRYSPQIASRVLGAYRRYQFCGTDIRMRGQL